VAALVAQLAIGAAHSAVVGVLTARSVTRLGYDYDYSNYVKQEGASNYGAGPRSAYGNDSSTQPPYATSQAV